MKIVRTFLEYVSGRVTDSDWVVIAGSRGLGRDIPDEDVDAFVEWCVDDAGFDIGGVVSGGARGADYYGERYARHHELPLAYFPVRDDDLGVDHWDRLGRSAGPRRNEAMAAFGDAVVALWDGDSPGTKSMISLAVTMLGADRVAVYNYRNRTRLDPEAVAQQ